MLFLTEHLALEVNQRMTACARMREVSFDFGVFFFDPTVINVLSLANRFHELFCFCHRTRNCCRDLPARWVLSEILSSVRNDSLSCCCFQRGVDCRVRPVHVMMLGLVLCCVACYTYMIYAQESSRIWLKLNRFAVRQHLHELYQFCLSF